MSDVETTGGSVAPTRTQTPDRASSGLFDPLHDTLGPLQLQSSAGAPSPERAAQGLSGSGGPLPHHDAIQASFGTHDVSGISAHTDAAAASASADMGALGYAMGDRVALKSTDLHTTAHEAAHVVQQRSGVSLKDGMGSAGDAYEAHADAVADKVVAGQSAQGLLDAVSGGGSPSVGAVQFKNTIVDNPHDLTNTLAPGTGAALLQESSGAINEFTSFGGLSNDCGTSMSTMRLPGIDDMSGTEPKSGTWPDWWAAAAPKPNNYWVRGHLLNHNLGGPGEKRNLTPITKSCNSQHHSLVEKAAKKAVADGCGLGYDVTVNYGAGPSFMPTAGKDPAASVWTKIATGLTCSWYFDDGSGKTGAGSKTIPNTH